MLDSASRLLLLRKPICWSSTQEDLRFLVARSIRNLHKFALTGPTFASPLGLGYNIHRGLKISLYSDGRCLFNYLRQTFSTLFQRVLHGACLGSSGFMVCQSTCDTCMSLENVTFRCCRPSWGNPFSSPTPSKRVRQVLGRLWRPLLSTCSGCADQMLTAYPVWLRGISTRDCGCGLCGLSMGIST